MLSGVFCTNCSYGEICKIFGSNGSVVKETIANIPAKLSGTVYQGGDGRVFIAKSSDAGREIVYWNANNEIQFDLLGTSGASLYPLSGM